MSSIEGRIIVFGAGALGSLIGGKLARRNRIALIGRPAHISAIRQDGLRLGGRSSGTIRCNPNFTALEDINEMRPQLRTGDVVFLTVKAAQIRQATETLAKTPADASSLPLVAFQNGTGFEKDLEGATGFEILHAVSHLGATWVEPGLVEDWGGEILLPDSPLGNTIRDTFKQARIASRSMSDLEHWRWKKIAFNCTLNALSALMAVRNKDTVIDVFRPLRRAVLEEVRIEAEAMGISMPTAEELLNEFEGLAGASNNVNSMIQDIQRGRPTEIRFLNRAIAEMALAGDRNAPANVCLAEGIERIETCSNDEEYTAVRNEALAKLRELTCPPEAK